MSIGDEVILIADPWTHGTGTIKGIARNCWLWIEWADGHFDSYPAHALELATVWEDRVLTSAA